jgi:hypothetical protein
MYKVLERFLLYDLHCTTRIEATKRSPGATSHKHMLPIRVLLPAHYLPAVKAFKMLLAI